MNWKRFAFVATLALSMSACGDDEIAVEDPCVSDPTAAGCDENPPDEEPGEDIPDEVTEIPDTCNGDVSFCDRRFDQMVFPGTHNSMSVEEEGWIAANQNKSMRTQLADGVRTFLFDVHPKDSRNGGLMLCHSICLLGKRPLQDGLKDFRDFLLTNRGEVVTFIIQNEVPVDDLFAELEAAGLERWAYVYEGGEWPTMREMIDANKRLVISVESGTPSQPWGQNVWNIAWDNPYSYEQLSEMDCRKNRGDSNAALFLMNHWLGRPLPSPEWSEEANTYEALMTHVETCYERHGRYPTFIAVDHYDLGGLFDVVRAVNDLVAASLEVEN